MHTDFFSNAFKKSDEIQADLHIDLNIFIAFNLRGYNVKPNSVCNMSNVSDTSDVRNAAYAHVTVNVWVC